MHVLTQNPSAVAAEAAAQARSAAQVAREQVQAAREQAQAQREAAQQARDDARDQARDAREGAQSGGGVRVITITTPDGKTITLSNPTADALAQLGFPVQVDSRDADPGPYIIGGIAIIASAVILIVALTFRHRVKMRGAPAAIPADLTQRLARMEVGIESVAVEVERISEGQRFTTRLLSDRERVEVPRG